jgi:putative tricarboxylic transport membrane protein
MIGSFSIANSATDIVIMLLFGVIGYLMKKISLEAAPMVLAFVLGPMLETSLRQALIKSEGSPVVFFTRPISATFLIIAIALMLAPLLPWFRRHRPGLTIEQEEDR